MDNVIANSGVEGHTGGLIVKTSGQRTLLPQAGTQARSVGYFKKWRCTIPNWCANSLLISGPKKDLEKFKVAAYSKNEEGPQLISIGKLYPIPEDLMITSTSEIKTDEDAERWKSEDGGKLREKQQANKKKYGYLDWYMWCVDHWGTKWDLCDVDLMYEEDKYRNDKKSGKVIKTGKAKICYAFNTAWSPPNRAFLQISKLFPSLKFEIEFEEPGCAFQGVFRVQNGKVLFDECHDYEPYDGEDDDGEAGMRDEAGKLIQPS